MESFLDGGELGVRYRGVLDERDIAGKRALAILSGSPPKGIANGAEGLRIIPE